MHAGEQFDACGSGAGTGLLLWTEPTRHTASKQHHDSWSCEVDAVGRSLWTLWTEPSMAKQTKCNILQHPKTETAIISLSLPISSSFEANMYLTHFGSCNQGSAFYRSISGRCNQSQGAAVSSFVWWAGFSVGGGVVMIMSWFLSYNCLLVPPNSHSSLP